MGGRRRLPPGSNMFGGMLRCIPRDVFVDTSMTVRTSEDTPTLQRVYNRIWLLAILGTLFFFVVYLGWGIVDILAVPTR